MNLNRTLLTTALLTTLATTPVFAGRGPGPGTGNGPGDPGTCATCVTAPLDEPEAATLTFMREEEKLARDVYQQSADLWAIPVFAKIAASEERHTGAVLKMLNKYSLPDPAANNPAGVFSNQDLQQLYNELAAQSAQSLLDALKAGALIEEMDIEDNQQALDATDSPDLKMLYDNLLRGSRNHLRAFVSELERQGVTYEAQYLDPAIVELILDSDHERGGHGGGPRQN